MSSGLRAFGLGGRPQALDGSTSEEPHTEINTPNDVFEKCYEAVKEHDEKVCRGLKDEINFLMVVTGLFLAIVTSFTIESYKFLQEDKQESAAQLLVEVVRVFNDTNARGHAKLPERFIADHRGVVVHQLWYLSTILSLVAVMMGTFCLQWISAFERRDDSRKSLISVAEILRRARYVRQCLLVGV